jgi:mannose-1-phosphate guanylyltransferase
MISGDERPKQFCPLFGGSTLLEQTLRRSELNIPPQQLIVSLTSPHAKWYSQQVGLNASQCVIQPANKGTAPPILHSLLSLKRLDAQALVAILPCDHHYADEQLFSLALESAFEIAAKRDDSVVLLGAKPDYPEVEYGWIELDSPLEHKEVDLFRVRAFREKPPVEIARTLLERGSVWNTFVMVGHVQAFLDMARAAVPELLTSLRRARLWAHEETHIAASVYDGLPSVCFSHRVLSVETRRLAVLRLNNVGWSDLGDPGRAAMAVHNSGCKPTWIGKWKFPMGVVAPPEEAAVATA